MRTILVTILCSATLSGAILVDRIAVIIGKQVLKTSDVERDVRVTSFINRQPVDLSPPARRKAADRLVDQQMIREELSAQGYARAADGDADALLKQMIHDRFHASDGQMRLSLARYGLTHEDLREQLLWQLTVLRFIDQRFRPGVLVTDEEIRAYYAEHIIDLKKDYPKDSSFEAISQQIKTSLEGQRIDQEFEAWLEQTRKRMRVEYKAAAFQ